MNIAIVGWEEGLAGQVSTWLERDLGWTIRCYVHPFNDPPAVDAQVAVKRPAKRFSFPQGDPLRYRDLPLLVGTDWPLQLQNLGLRSVACCLSNPDDRKLTFEKGSRAGLSFPPIVHPSAQVLPESELGAGVVIEPNCYVGYRAELQVGVNMHAGSQVDHHSVLGAFVTLLPGAIVAGNSLIRSASTIGLGARISNRVELGEGSIVGAGATVLRSFLEQGQTLVGVPATPVAKRTE